MNNFYFDNFRSDKAGQPKLSKKILDYEAKVASLSDMSLEDTDFYKDYLSRFEVMNVRTPEMELEFPYKWDTMLRLAAASFSCKTCLSLGHNSNEELPDLHLSVSSNKEEYKILANLSFFQVERLFYIFVDEILALELHRNDNPDAEVEIRGTRNQKVVEWNMGLAQFKPMLRLRKAYKL